MTGINTCPRKPGGSKTICSSRFTLVLRDLNFRLLLELPRNSALTQEAAQASSAPGRSSRPRGGWRSGKAAQVSNNEDELGGTEGGGGSGRMGGSGNGGGLGGGATLN